MKKINYKDLTLINTCPFCGEEHSVDVNADDYFAWIAGDLIQDAFPYLAPDEREIIQTGICPTCWHEMLPPEEVEE
jgi:hypothetical protein